ncbi:peptidase inhibitor family I36 protein [Amycolatopsis pittospori]|uniref:peptidase inhibitor family I36 protein n=1 Tax=Amycolatopsis pittospori TaxID=2749434 RepID=UPI0015F08BA8|nr:peptidase inhibitor family I36 protein [Amycolatopsis pittospori]
MKLRATARRLSIAVGVAAAVLSLAATTSAAASETDPFARFAAAGIQLDRLEPGWTVEGNTILWDGGNTRLTIREPGAAAVQCPSGYVCLFEHDDLRGDMWASNVRGRYHYLPDLDFNDKMSSWQNRSAYDARWFVNVSGTPNPYYCMGAGLGSEHPPPSLNDKASAVYIYNSSTVC